MKYFLFKLRILANLATGLRGTIAFSAIMLLFALTARAQTSTVLFENEPIGATSFTNNGVTFNILSHSSTFDIYFLANGGWNGSGNDTRFIDNTGSIGPNASFSIKTTSNLFKVNRFWIFLANNFTNPNATGTLTVTGKLSGVTKFSTTKNTGFTTSTGITNGYTLIDLTNLNGMNYANIVIDQLQLTLGGDYQYASLDAFTWVKDSGMVLPVTLTDFSASLSKAGVLKADWKTATETNNSHFVLQSSVDGKTWKDLLKKNAAVNGANGASYQVETNIGSISLAGFGLLTILLLPFAHRRHRLIAILAVSTLFAVSCAKSDDLNAADLESGKTGANGTIYLRLAQVDLDGTTTYSDVLSVKAK